MATPRALINVSLYDYEQFMDHAYVLFDHKILDVGPMHQFKDKGYEVIDLKGHLLLPGFVVAHTHVYATFARGWENSFEYEDFMDILKSQWWKLDRHLTLNDIYYSGVISASDHLLQGVTTMIDHHASGVVKGALSTLKEAISDRVGLRGIYAFETSDRFSVNQCIEENLDFMATSSTYHSGLFGMHASLSLSEQTLKNIKHRIQNKPVHIHVAESELDQEDAFINVGERVVERLNRHGLINPDSILAHALHIDDNEAAIIKKQGAVVALNPSSNMNNGVGFPDVKRLKKHGIPMMIGNDGLNSAITGEYLTLFYGTHMKENHPHAMSLDDLNAMIKQSFVYASKQLNTKLGQFKPGYEADFLTVPYTPPTPLKTSNVMGHLVFGLFAGFKPKDVYIGGSIKVEDYQLLSDVKGDYKTAHAKAQALWERIKKEDDA